MEGPDIIQIAFKYSREYWNVKICGLALAYMNNDECISIFSFISDPHCYLRHNKNTPSQTQEWYLLLHSTWPLYKAENGFIHEVGVVCQAGAILFATMYVILEKQ